MQLSFVIPTRNQAPFLRQCIDSCFAQQIPESEVVVVDGASSDHTVEVLKSYGQRIRWVSEPDRGQSDAINKGIRMASGDVIAWINSDDYYREPGVITRLLQELKPGIDIVYGNGERVDVEGRPLGPYNAREIHRVEDILIYPASFVLQPTLLFRRSLFLAVGGLDEKLHYSMDYELWIRMFGAAQGSRFVPQTVACARYHTDAKSVAAMGKQIREVARVKQRYAKELRITTRDRARMYAGIASLGAYWLAVRLGLKRAT